MQNFKEQIKKIATDLLNLEINTIIKPTIEGTKMPGPRHALLDIAMTFDCELIRLGAKRFEDHDDTGGFRAFDQLRGRAKNKILELEEGGMTIERVADVLMLHRIKDKSDQIKGMFNSLKRRYPNPVVWDNNYTHAQVEEKRPPFPLNPDELVLIRKIWEIGVEDISMQTVIQLDGDVITRIQPKYISPAYELIHKFHNQSIDTSVSFWKDLVGIVNEFFNSTLKIFFKQ
ncbi:MAG: hypothetical protein E3K32_11590 [wastewater metagenome]|nr:hypothetical protein [Candidatus Loosdrechtia aerotolerans]